MLSATTGAIAIALLLYTLYRWLLPKPLPGIPHNREAMNLFGDIPSLRAEMKTRGDIFMWFLDQNRKTQSAISQVFLSPFGKPTVVLADARETREIQLHRTKDFDRSYMIQDTFSPLIGTNQFVQKTGPLWKRQRRLAQDTMTPAFLHQVAAPNIYNSGLRFIQLWETKARLANGKSFSADSDLYYVTLDAVLMFTFGSEYRHSAIQSQLDGVAALSETDSKITTAEDASVQFPAFELHDEIDSLLRLAEQVETVQGKPFMKLQWFLVQIKSQYRHWLKTKDECIRRQVEKSVERLKTSMDDAADKWARSGIDLVINRERKMAEKENRAPDFFSNNICDELFGFLIAGHDTTSSSMSWSMKLLAQHQQCQKHLREELRSAFSAAIAENRQPTAQEITGSSVPYLDAIIEEFFRFSPVAPFMSRESVHDTELLGHHIPKGTVVLYLNNGPGFTMPSYKIEEGRRSQHSQQEGKGGKVKLWDEDDITLFKPDRWLVKSRDEEGVETVSFDPNAGPMNVFGLGIRSCFGRRLAYIEFRILLTLLIWNFELLELPENLSDFTGVVGVVYKPKHCYVRLRKVHHSAAAV